MEAAREELAKAWLQGIIDRSPLEEVGRLPVGVLAREAPELIAEILREAAGATVAPSGAEARVAELSGSRSPPTAVHRDLGALHTLLLGALQRELPDRERFARAAERLAETFGSIHASIGDAGLGAAARRPAAEPARDRRAPPAPAYDRMARDEAGAAEPGAPRLSGVAELHDSLGHLIAGYRRYGHPFAVLSVDVEGLRRINYAYGRDAGDRMLEAVGATLERELPVADHPFRYTEDDFCVLVPYHDAADVRPLAERVRDSLAALPAGDPSVSIAVGIASCPQHGESVVQLLDAAQEATYAAKAAGSGIAVSNGTP